jgi:hypothetical protein
MGVFEWAELDGSRILELERPDILRRYGLWIESIEVTQAIQYRRAGWHLSDPADQQTDNAARLVAGKPAWVRVYVRSLFGMSGVTGTLEIHKRNHGLLWIHHTTLNPQPPGSVDASFSADYASERGTLGNTLNFVIPADKMCGTLRLKVDISGGSRSDSSTVYADVTLQQTLRLAGIMIAYNGPSSSAPGAPNLNLAAPTVANMQATAAWTLTTFPVRSVAQFRSAGTITLSNPLTDAPSCAGCCSTNWVNLNANVASQKTADGNQAGWVYYGLLPAGVPMGPIIGCESSGVSTGPVNNQITMAHEIGHGCGLAHGPCGGVGSSADASYPAYEPYDPAGTPQGSIGEYGLDINNGNIMSPATFKDFMSYCNPDWISLYHHGKLINNAKLNPAKVCVDYLWWKDLVFDEVYRIPDIWPDPPPDWQEVPVHMPTEAPMPVISIIGTITDGDLNVRHIARTVARPHVDGGAGTAMIARLMGKDGEVLARGAVMRLVSKASCGCDCDGKSGSEPDAGPYLVQAFIPDVDGGATLEIRENKDVIWSRSAPPRPVAIDDFRCGLLRKGHLSASWRAKSYSDTVEFWLRWSLDGETWRALATGLTGNKAAVDVGHLPPGRLLVQLIAHDGFYSTASENVEVQVPERGPEVSILHPRSTRTYVEGQTLRLVCAATSADGSIVDPQGCVWTLNGSKEIGRGIEAWIEAPKAGKHRAKVTVQDSHGTTEAVVRFETIAMPAE